MVFQKILSTTASRFDAMVAHNLLGRSERARRRSTSESLGVDERLLALAKIGAIYDRPAHYDLDGPFFASVPSEAPQITRVRTFRIPAGGQTLDVEVEDARFPSVTDTFDPDVLDKLHGHIENRRGAARIFRVRDRPHRPAVMLVHGYRAGQYSIEQRVWPIRWLLTRGFDVALFVLPLHAVRAPRKRGPLFPSSDPRVTNECFRQAIGDLATLHAWFRRQGSRDVGVMGMSLGGYTAALYATLAKDLSFAVPIIPVASFADMAALGGRLVGTDDEKQAQHAGLEAVHRVVSPLARPAAISSERLLVVAGVGDRITPIAQARALADHFNAPLETFPGGHILQFGRGQAFRAVGRMFSRLELLRDDVAKSVLHSRSNNLS